MRRPNWYDYDGDLQMIRLPKDSAEPDMTKLRFLRWSLEHRSNIHMDGWIVGPPSGPFADSTPADTPQPPYTGKA